jgi:hypothetical protein
VEDPNIDWIKLHEAVIGCALPFVTPIPDADSIDCSRNPVFINFVRPISSPAILFGDAEHKTASATIPTPVSGVAEPIHPEKPATINKPANSQEFRVPFTPDQIRDTVRIRRWWECPRSVSTKVFAKKANSYARKFAKWEKEPTVDNLRYLSNAYSALEKIGAYYQ